MHHLKSKCILKYEDRNEIEIEAFLFQIASCVKVVIFPSTSRNSQHLTFFCRNHADGFCGLLAHSNSFLKWKRGGIMMKLIHNIATCLFVFMSNSEGREPEEAGKKMAIAWCNRHGTCERLEWLRVSINAPRATALYSVLRRGTFPMRIDGMHVAMYMY